MKVSPALIPKTCAILLVSTLPTSQAFGIDFGQFAQLLFGGTGGNLPIYRVTCFTETHTPDFGEIVRIDHVASWLYYPTGTTINPPDGIQYAGTFNTPFGERIESSWLVATAHGLYMHQCTHVFTPEDGEPDEYVSFWTTYVTGY